ncbi:unnamed protein product [Ectocarpus sp. 12 AP-2014]
MCRGTRSTTICTAVMSLMWGRYVLSFFPYPNIVVYIATAVRSNGIPREGTYSTPTCDQPGVPLARWRAEVTHRGADADVLPRCLTRSSLRCLWSRILGVKEVRVLCAIFAEGKGFSGLHAR